MPDFSVSGYFIEDFSGRLSGNRTINRETTGDRLEGTSTTLSADAETVGFTISDDDSVLQDAFQETGAFSTLTDDLTLGDTTFPAGSHIELEFSLQTDDGITLWIGRIGDGTSNSGQNQIVFSSEPLTPGQRYDLVNSDDGVDIGFSAICFARDTLIATPDGQQRVQDLQPGDLVLTRDTGPQPVRWVGHRDLAPWQLAKAPQLAPIRIRAGALGNGLPHSDLIVSPQHRIAISDWRAELMFGSQTVLVPAKSLLNDTSIIVDRTLSAVSYYHVLLPDHALILANGHWAESLLAGPEARNSLTATQLAELEQLVPGWDTLPDVAALPALRAQDARVLA